MPVLFTDKDILFTDSTSLSTGMLLPQNVPTNTITDNKLNTHSLSTTTFEAKSVIKRTYQPGEIIEYLTSPCNGTTVVGKAGTYTFQNVTGTQGNTYSFTDIAGSVISYRPPYNTTRVVYRFTYAMCWIHDHAISHHQFLIDNQVVWHSRHSRSGRYPEDKYTFEWTIPIGGGSNSNTGRQASWTGFKELKMQWRSYGGSNAREVHRTNYWNGGGTAIFTMPILSVIAIA